MKLSIVAIIITVFSIGILMAQPGPGGGGPPTPAVPIDGGIGLILAAGGLLGLLSRKKKRAS